MKTLLIFLVIFLSSFKILSAQGADFAFWKTYNDFYSETNIPESVIDILSIDEIINFRSVSDSSRLDYPDFFVSKTNYNNGLKEGLHWSSGSWVPLPTKFIPGTTRLSRDVNGNLELSWFEKDGEEYLLYVLSLPEINIDSLPRVVSVKAFLRE